MLYKKQNSKWALGKYPAVLALVALVVMLTAARDHGTPTDSDALLSAPSAETMATQLKNAVGKLGFASGVTAEGTTVRGIVKNAQTGEPLPEATIIVVGTNQGTNTDEKGVFELKNVPLNGSLAVSFVGFVTKEIKITKPNQLLSVSMQREERPLEKIVVVGYGAPFRPSDTNSPNAEPKKSKEEFMVVEQMPEFPGGMTELNKYLAKNTRYPAEASRKGVEGEVLISFMVNEDGAIREPRIVRSVGAGIDEEAMRVVLGMPHWKAAKQNGRPVPMYYTLPVEFMLDLDDKELENRINKEKRQGNATEYQNYRMPDFDFNKAADYGLPTHGPGDGTFQSGATNSSVYSKLKSPDHIERDQILIIPADSIPPATFMNYSLPDIKATTPAGTFMNYSLPVPVPGKLK